jgi:hypothetical protein
VREGSSNQGIPRGAGTGDPKAKKPRQGRQRMAAQARVLDPCSKDEYSPKLLLVESSMVTKKSRRLGRMLALAALVLWSGATAAQGTEDRASERSRKPAWKWSVEERLLGRFDPDAMKARAAKKRAEYEEMKKRAPELVADGGPSREGVDSITGSETPELFLPWELFNHLLERGFSFEEEPSESRRSIDERAAALGFGRDFWPRLENIASPFLQLRRERFTRAMTGSTAPSHSVVETKHGLEMNREDLLFCRTRAEALAAAKAEFGEEPFLRLLYEVVAPPIGLSYPVDKESLEQLRFLERGCQ